MSAPFDPRIPEGDPATAWTRRKADYRLVSPLNRSRFTVVVVGTGLAGAGCAAALGELGYRVVSLTFHDAARRAHSVAAQGGINAARALVRGATEPGREACVPLSILGLCEQPTRFSRKNPDIRRGRLEAMPPRATGHFACLELIGRPLTSSAKPRPPLGTNSMDTQCLPAYSIHSRFRIPICMASSHTRSPEPVILSSTLVSKSCDYPLGVD